VQIAATKPNQKESPPGCVLLLQSSAGSFFKTAADPHRTIDTWPILCELYTRSYWS
jgi:hypothetical protein